MPTHLMMLSLYSRCSFFRLPLSRFSTSSVIKSSLSSVSVAVDSDRKTTGYAGVQIDEEVDSISSGGDKKVRLDSWLSSRIDGISRARVQSSIRNGHVILNGHLILKVSHMVRNGDNVKCTIAELQPLKAEPEDIPLNIVYEDDHVLVVNKPAHMVVHPAPDNANGTLVNGILHHCSLPACALSNQEVPEIEDTSDDEFGCMSFAQSCDEVLNPNAITATVRPGIVHRLDKGTSGLLVVAKNEHSHAHLSEQFKERTIHRVYTSLTCGAPSPSSGRVNIPIGRDANNRIRMTAVTGASKSTRARHAASRYKVLEMLAGGGSALVEWRLETGRTHQIRAHAKYLGIPLLGDEVYGGTSNMALSLLRPKVPSNYHEQLQLLLCDLERPCLHALALGFKHPHTGENMKFSCPSPADFIEILNYLREIRMEKVQ